MSTPTESTPLDRSVYLLEPVTGLRLSLKELIHQSIAQADPRNPNHLGWSQILLEDQTDIMGGKLVFPQVLYEKYTPDATITEVDGRFSRIFSSSIFNSAKRRLQRVLDVFNPLEKDVFGPLHTSLIARQVQEINSIPAFLRTPDSQVFNLDIMPEIVGPAVINHEILEAMRSLLREGGVAFSCLEATPAPSVLRRLWWTRLETSGMLNYEEQEKYLQEVIMTAEAIRQAVYEQTKNELFLFPRFMSYLTNLGQTRLSPLIGGDISMLWSDIFATKARYVDNSQKQIEANRQFYLALNRLIKLLEGRQNQTVEKPAITKDPIPVNLNREAIDLLLEFITAYDGA